MYHVLQSEAEIAPFPTENWELRGPIEIKGKGLMDTYLLRGITEEESHAGGEGGGARRVGA